MKLRFALIALMASASLAAMTVPEPKPDLSNDAIFGPALQELDLVPTICFTLTEVDHSDLQDPDVVQDTPVHADRLTSLFATADVAFSNGVHALQVQRFYKPVEYEFLCTGRLMIKVDSWHRFRLEPTPAAWLRPDKPRVIFS